MEAAIQINISLDGSEELQEHKYLCGALTIRRREQASMLQPADARVDNMRLVEPQCTAYHIVALSERESIDFCNVRNLPLLRWFRSAFGDVMMQIALGMRGPQRHNDGRAANRGPDDKYGRVDIQSQTVGIEQPWLLDIQTHTQGICTLEAKIIFLYSR